MADFEEMVPSPLSVEEEDELWTGTLKVSVENWCNDESGRYREKWQLILLSRTRQVRLGTLRKPRIH